MSAACAETGEGTTGGQRPPADPSASVSSERPIGGAQMVAVVYVYPVRRAEYDQAARRFVSTYREFPPLADHTLHVVCNGEAWSEENAAIFAGIPCRFHFHDDSGWDIGAFQMAAREIECDLLVCLGGHTHFKRAGWLGRMCEAFNEYGPGLYGSSASYYLSDHIRTAAFWCHPGLIHAYGKRVRTHQERYDFEHGANSITALAESLGLGCSMVTWEGIYPKAEWRDPPDIFWRGDQRNSLCYDRQFEVYDASLGARPFLAAAADGWGSRVDGRGLGRTENEWLAEPGWGDVTLGADGRIVDPWTFLAREQLRRLKAAAPDAAAAAVIEDAFFDDLMSELLTWVSTPIFDRLGLTERDRRSAGITRAAVRSAIRTDRPIGSVSRAALPDTPWGMRDGMSLAPVRRALLRVLQPFAERQQAKDAHDRLLIGLLSEEVEWLRDRGAELERSSPAKGSSELDGT